MGVTLGEGDTLGDILGEPPGDTLGDTPGGHPGGHLHRRSAASSILVVGTTTPVAGCSRFAAPITPYEYSTASYAQRRTVDSPMWLSYARTNQLGAFVARGLGVRFLDVAEASAMRPDGAMARFWRENWARTGKIKEDCVHYCLPGPVDAWSTLVYDWLLSTGAVVGDDVNRDHDATSGANASARSPNVAIESERAGAKGGGRGAPRRPPARAARGVPRSSHEGFFSLSLERWLSERGAGLSLERCSSSGPPEVRCGTHVGLRLSRQWWWPFNCSS
jgi:hypothetical protein